MVHIRSDARQKLSLKRKFVTLALPLLILINFVLYQIYQKQRDNQMHLLKQAARNQLVSHRQKIEKFSIGIFNDLKIILNHHELINFVRDKDTGSKQNLIHDLIQFAKYEKKYDQIRYIDADGMELIRINFNEGRPAAETEERLQNKKNRYYFYDTFKLEKNEIFMSPMDLNIEKGVIEVPLKPMIRIGTPILEGNTKKGILLVNYLARYILEQLSGSLVSPIEHFLLINQNGYFLKGLDRKDEWGFMFPGKDPITFEIKFPETWQIIKEQNSGFLVNEIGIFSFDTIFPLKMGAISSDGAPEAFSPSKKVVREAQYHWKLVHFVATQDFFTRYLKELKTNLIRLAGLFSLIIIVTSYFSALFLYRKKLADIELTLAHNTLEKKVKEQVKALNCLYEISRLSSDSPGSMEELFESIIQILPNGYQYPEVTVCRITLDDINVQSNGFTADFYPLKSLLIISGNTRGSIEVYYSEEKERADEGPFLNEEVALLDSVTKQVSTIISRTETRHEKKKLAEQLRHSQKMEAIGHLSGGIAHDFNNILTVINGFAELGKISCPKDSAIRQHLDSIMAAGEKAASLTRQLLVFSRKDEIQPKPLQINKVIGHTVKLLKRLVGENIRQEILLSPDVSDIQADKTQIDQLLFNLIINARDAINEKQEKNTKQITITTNEVQVDEEFAKTHLDIAPGSYILIEVTDTGIGMSRETQDKIFTPFFTTKSKKSGTGLGLATVYGIVRQNQGAISVYSEKGIGTIFKVYWPVLKEKKVVSIQDVPTHSTDIYEDTVVLVVEDDKHLNLFACNALKAHSIEVLNAFNGEQAMEVLKANHTRVNLLFTDVVLPGMSGRELADKALQLNPGLSVLYTSGYTETFFSENGVLPPDIHFLRKPYSIKRLLEKIADSLQDGKT